MSGLPREILKWMQSLDLSYSVKNVKRDFANGFLVAEILSRYYKSDISLHSFDNGIGLVKRMENWNLLERFFRKVGFPIERATIDAVIHCKKDAAIPLMEQLYTLLTHKTLTSVRPIRDTEILPAFARPTASQLIKERLSEGDLASVRGLPQPDAHAAPNRAAEVLANHMQKLKLEKELDPQRFQPRPRQEQGGAMNKTAGNTMAGTRRGKGQDMGASAAPSMQFKEIQVRQVDEKGNLLQSRNGARSPPQQQQQYQPQSQFTSSAASSTHAFHPSASSAAVPPAQPLSPSAPSSSFPPCLPFLSQHLLSLLGGPDSPEGQQLLAASSSPDSPPKEPILTFVDHLCTQLPDEHVSYLLGQLSLHATDSLIHASLSNPKEYWVVSNLFMNLLSHLPQDSTAFATTCGWMSSFGLGVAQRDPFVSSQLFMDFTMAKLVALMREQPRKIFQVARVSYAFQQAESVEEHAKVLRAIQEATGAGEDDASESSKRLFYSILAALAPFEGHLLVSNNNALLSSYLKQAQKGLSTSYSPRVRATALSILAPLCANPAVAKEAITAMFNTVKTLLPWAQPKGEEEEDAEEQEPEQEGADSAAGPSTRLQSDDGWLLDAELFHVLSCTLSNPEVSSALPELVSRIHVWVERMLMDPEIPMVTLRAALAHLSHVLGSQPPLRKVWMSEWLEQEEKRRAMLAPIGSPEADQVEAGIPSELLDQFCPSLREVYHPLTLAQSLGDLVRVHKLDNLSSGHINLLSTCVEDAFVGGATGLLAPFPDEEGSEWSAVFLSLRDHLMVELCDASLSETVIVLLRRFLLDARTTQAAQTIFHPNVNGAPAPPLYGLLRFMFPDADEEAQLNLAGFLEELAASPAFVQLVHNNLQVFAQQESEKMDSSPLGPLLQKLNQQAAEAAAYQARPQ